MNVPGSPDTDGKVTADGIKTYAQADLGTASFEDSTAFATSVQGGKADTAVQPADLGNSAGLDVGTTAGTVAAGNDSRFTDARTPTAHATSHQNGGTDEIATATPGANAIPKAGAGGTLAAGWLPAPDTTTLGGVKRNAGASGQFVSGIDSNGALIHTDFPLRLSVPFSDQTTNLSVGTKMTFTWRFGAATLSATPIDLTEAPTGSAAQFDVKKNGSSIYSTKPTIDNGETSTSTAATAAVISTTTIADDDVITIIIDQVGSTNPGKGAIIYFSGAVRP